MLYLIYYCNYTVLYVCPGLHTLTDTHRIPSNYHCNRLIQMHSHWPCTLCVVYSFFPLACDNASAKRGIFELFCKKVVINLFYFLHVRVQTLAGFFLSEILQPQVPKFSKNDLILLLLEQVTSSSLFKVRMCKLIVSRPDNEL